MLEPNKKTSHEEFVRWEETWGEDKNPQKYPLLWTNKEKLAQDWEREPESQTTKRQKKR